MFKDLSLESRNIQTQKRLLIQCTVWTRNVNADGQISGNKREDSVYEESANIEQDEQVSGSKYVYEEPANTQRSGGRKEYKEPQANNWPVKCFMAMMIALVIAVVVLAVSANQTMELNWELIKFFEISSERF